MKRYKYIIVDDDNMDRVAINYYLKSYPFLEYKESFPNANSALYYIDNNPVDILFLDIHMPEITGLEFQRKIKNRDLCTVFVTSYPEFAIDGYELEAFDYMVKPVNEQRVETCAHRIKEYLDLKNKAELFESSFKDGAILVKKGHGYTSILPYEVIYLEALKDYTKVVLHNNKSTTIHGNLGSVLRDKNFSDLIRIHRSYAIQKRYISLVKASEVILINGVTLPIGKYYREDLLKKIS